MRQLARTDYVNKPKIHSLTGDYATHGEELKLDCEVEIKAGVVFTINWTLPKNNLAELEHRVIKSAVTKESNVKNPELQIGRSSITVNKLDIDTDQGYYKCEVIDHSGNRNSDNILVTILGMLLLQRRTR